MYGDYRALLPEWEFGHALGMQMGMAELLVQGAPVQHSGVVQHPQQLIGPAKVPGGVAALRTIPPFLAAGFYHRFSGVRQGRFAPIFLDKTDPLLPKNDLELWCASTYGASHSLQQPTGRR